MKRAQTPLAQGGLKASWPGLLGASAWLFLFLKVTCGHATELRGL